MGKEPFVAVLLCVHRHCLTFIYRSIAYRAVHYTDPLKSCTILGRFSRRRPFRQLSSRNIDSITNRFRSLILMPWQINKIAASQRQQFPRLYKPLPELVIRLNQIHSVNFWVLQITTPFKTTRSFLKSITRQDLLPWIFRIINRKHMARPHHEQIFSIENPARPIGAGWKNNRWL